MDEHTLSTLNTALQPVVAIAVIIGGIFATIYHLKKLGWHAHAAAIVIGVSPILFIIAGMFAFYFLKRPISASALFSIAFFIQLIVFARNPAPLKREDVMWFGIACCIFVFSVIFVIFSDLISRTLELISGNTDAIGKLIKALGK